MVNPDATEKVDMNSALPNADESSEPKSNTPRKLAYAFAPFMGVLIGVVAVDTLRGTWPDPWTLIGYAAGAGFAGWIMAKRSYDGWSTRKAAAIIGAFFAACLIGVGIIAIGTSPASGSLLGVGFIILILSGALWIEDRKSQ